jgi:hypothetical protein
MVLVGHLTIQSSTIGSYVVSGAPSRPSAPLTATSNSHIFSKHGGLRAFVTSQQAIDEDRTMPTEKGPGNEKRQVDKIDLAFSRNRSESVRTGCSGNSFLDTEITPVDSRVDINGGEKA